MDVPPEIAFRDVEPREALKEEIQARITDLEKVYSRLTSCRVMVESASNGGSTERFEVRIDMTVPGNELVVRREPPAQGPRQDVFTAVDEAFDTARRRLREFARKQRGDVKNHDLPPHARVVKLFRDEGYGFLETEDGREVYFHENAVRNGDFADLEVGTEVRYAEAQGDEGPQASTVVPLSGEEILRDRDVPLQSPSS